MPLKTGMSAAEMEEYLVRDLAVSVVNDVGPCLNLGKPEGGYFGVPRLVLGYVDYLGALHNGYKGKTDRRGRRIFTDGRYAKKFLEDIFGTIDPNYKKYGALLWEIYRNGTTHLYEPLKLQNAGRTIGWFCHKGDRIGQPYSATPIPHLVPFAVAHTPNWWMQPISIACLYDDLQAAIKAYASKILADPALQTNFRETADGLQIPEPTTVSW